MVGPRPLKRVLAAQAALEPLAFAFVDCARTEPGAPPAGAATELVPATSLHVCNGYTNMACFFSIASIRPSDLITAACFACELVSIC